MTEREDKTQDYLALEKELEKLESKERYLMKKLNKAERALGEEALAEFYSEELNEVLRGSEKIRRKLEDMRGEKNEEETLKTTKNPDPKTTITRKEMNIFFSEGGRTTEEKWKIAEKIATLFSPEWLEEFGAKKHITACDARPTHLFYWTINRSREIREQKRKQEKILEKETKDDVLAIAEFAFDILIPGMEEGREYMIRYDKSRIRMPEQESLIKEYARLLSKKGGTKVRVIGNKELIAENGQKALISVECRKEQDVIGSGQVDIKIEEGTLEENLLRLVGMINIALAASGIPDGEDMLPAAFLTEYGRIIGFIERQYKSIVNEDFQLWGTGYKMVKMIKHITLLLPKPHRRDSQELSRQYERVLAALRAA